MTSRALFLQCTNAGHYPPILNASALLADRGWRVTVLSSPSKDTVGLATGRHPGVSYCATSIRPRNTVRPIDYLTYTVAAATVALHQRPGLIYASDPLSALPALMAAKVSGAQIIYHEHDSPNLGALRSPLARWRSAVARQARLVIAPNRERGEIMRQELGFPPERLHIVWNLPRRSELPPLAPREDGPLCLYYHGSITPERLPESVIEAIQRFGGRVVLKIAGYEAAGAPGYVTRLVQLGRAASGLALVEYVGQRTRADLFATAAQNQVGLALMPSATDDVNMRHMVGASNKAFDYMAAGMALLVSDTAAWRKMFAAPGFARTCDSADADSIAAALGWFLEHPDERRAMAARGRAKIEADWNYDTAFEPIIAALAEGSPPSVPAYGDRSHSKPADGSEVLDA